MMKMTLILMNNYNVMIEAVLTPSPSERKSLKFSIEVLLDVDVF